MLSPVKYSHRSSAHTWCLPSLFAFLMQACKVDEKYCGVSRGKKECVDISRLVVVAKSYGRHACTCDKWMRRVTEAVSIGLEPSSDSTRTTH
jgi:hypothetical protein